MTEENHTDDEAENLINYRPSDAADLEGIVYENRDGRHLLQFRAMVTYEFEVRDEEVAAGLKGIGEQILDEMDSPLADAPLSPSGVERATRESLSDNDGGQE